MEPNDSGGIESGLGRIVVECESCRARQSVARPLPPAHAYSCGSCGAKLSTRMLAEAGALPRAVPSKCPWCGATKVLPLESGEDRWVCQQCGERIAMYGGMTVKYVDREHPVPSRSLSSFYTYKGVPYCLEHVPAEADPAEMIPATRQDMKPRPACPVCGAFYSLSDQVTTIWVGIVKLVLIALGFALALALISPLIFGG